MKHPISKLLVHISKGSTFWFPHRGQSFSLRLLYFLWYLQRNARIVYWHRRWQSPSESFTAHHWLSHFMLFATCSYVQRHGRIFGTSGGKFRVQIWTGCSRRFFYVILRNFWDSTLNKAMTASFHILFNLLFIINPFIQPYTTSATNNAVK
jgi:hypothetical protein